MEAADTRPPWLAEVIAAIAACQTSLTAKIKAMQLDVCLLRQDLDKLRSRVAETEGQPNGAKRRIQLQSMVLPSALSKHR